MRPGEADESSEERDSVGAPQPPHAQPNAPKSSRCDEDPCRSTRVDAARSAGDIRIALGEGTPCVPRDQDRAERNLIVRTEADETRNDGISWSLNGASWAAMLPMKARTISSLEWKRFAILDGAVAWLERSLEAMHHAGDQFIALRRVAG